jgi:hypothetical protein
MPVYLCQPGVGAAEPWRHGIQVYAAPFDLMDAKAENSAVSTENVNDTNSNAITENNNNAAASESNNVARTAAEYYRMAIEEDERNSAADATASIINATGDVGGTHAASSHQNLSRMAQSGMEIRRIRHAEVVLVDDVCVAYGRHWLRLRWPGHKGGFAGYIALGKVNEPLSKQIMEAMQGMVTFLVHCLPAIRVWKRLVAKEEAYFLTLLEFYLFHDTCRKYIFRCRS